MNTLSKQGFLVDTVHCAPTLIINMYEYIMGTTKDFTPLSSLKILQPGGAVLSSKVLDALVAEGVNVKTTYGTTEIGPPFRTIPSTRDNPNCYSLRNLYPDNDKLKMEEVGEDLYELVVYKGFDLAADLWEGKPDDEPYRTNDLFFQEPPGSGFFAMRGRKDDVLVHSNGENTSAGPLQLELQSASKIIKRALVLGHSKPCVCLLVELNDEDSTSDSAGEEVWGIVKQVNERYPGHSRIMRSMIYILPKGSSLPVTPKGNVRRTEAERIFHDNISQLYDDVDHNPVSGLEDSEEPLEDFLRNRIADLAGVPLGHVKNQTTLYALNIDSRLALSLRASLSKRLGPVSLGTIFENPSIDKLLSFFQKKGQVDSKEAPSQIINQMISKLNAELSVWPTHSSTKKYTPSQTETVLLTGASGFLGTGLLESLTASPRITKIYAMIRGPNNEAKLRKSSTRRGLDVDKIMGGKKIEVLNYNMQDTSLGLECSDYTRLAQTVTIVVHTAWKMDFNQGVEYFEDDCIRSTPNPNIPGYTSRK